MRASRAVASNSGSAHDGSHYRFSSPSPIAGWEWKALLFLIVGSLALLLASLNYPIFRTDNIYGVIGTLSLKDGQGYVDISRANPTFLSKYPPGYSLSMAPFAHWAPYGLKWWRLASIVWQPAVLWLCFILMRRRTGARTALVITAIFALHPMMLWSHGILSNIGLTATVFLGILLVHERFEGWKKALLLGLLLGIGFYLHRSSTTLAATTLLWLVFRKEYQSAVGVLCLFLALAAPWCSLTYRHTGAILSPEYQGEWKGRVRYCHDGDHCTPGKVVRDQPFPIAAALYAWDNIPQFARILGSGLLPWTELPTGRRLGALADPLRHLTHWGLSFACILGWALEVRRRGWKNLSFVEFYLPFHIGMLLLFLPGFQYLVWLAPFIFYYGYRAADEALKLVSTPTRQRVFTAATCVLFCILVLRTRPFLRNMGRPTLDERDPRWSWVAKSTPENVEIYWLGIDKYAYGPWRWFDTGRAAVGTRRGNKDEFDLDKLEYIGIPVTAPELELFHVGWQVLHQESNQGHRGIILLQRPTSNFH